MRARLTYGRGPRLIAALFLAILIVATVLAIARPGARGGQGSQRTAGAAFAGIPEHGTLLGHPRAPATLLEFADLQCPFCAEYARDALPGLLRDWVRPGRLRLDLRLVAFIGPDSTRAARTAGAAALQDRLWQFSELFYLNQGTENSGYVTESFLRAIAPRRPASTFSAHWTLEVPNLSRRSWLARSRAPRSSTCRRRRPSSSCGRAVRQHRSTRPH
jgi:hypothetical protein